MKKNQNQEPMQSTEEVQLNTERQGEEQGNKNAQTDGLRYDYDDSSDLK
ncbi:hypothetical protein [Halalkalibacter akibai]|nr:hypothetical protein [Halalkalibacter akibai]